MKHWNKVDDSGVQPPYELDTSYLVNTIGVL